MYQHKILQHLKLLLSFSLIAIFLCSCNVGPKYVPPAVNTPSQYKEGSPDWKIAQPQDDCDRGQWWLIFNDPTLNSLENRLDISNQTIAQAAANYQQALDLVDEARASYFPTVTASAALTRQKNSSFSSGSGNNNSTLATAGTTTVVSSGSNVLPPFTTHSLLLDATWEPDLWGSVANTVEASKTGAQATEAQLALARLSAQASLAEYYYELRYVDNDQKILDNTVKEYQKTLQLTKNRYTAGVDSETDVVQALAQLQAAQATAINNQINRHLYEHAIAVLIGLPPAEFDLKFNPLQISNPPAIPNELPGELLERRPDIAEAERQVAQANANIGVAIAAFFPTLDLTGEGGWEGAGISHWINLPDLTWSLGSQLTQTIFDGGFRIAATRAAQAGYCATVANYRQVVLSAFQDVEDNLASVRILSQEAVVQNQAAATAEKALQLVINQYKAGTAQYTDVIVAQVTAYNAEKNASDVNGLRYTSTVGLIKALGGGWDVKQNV